MGSKARIVHEILPIMLDKEHDTFVDAFCGGCSVIENVPDTYRRIANDDRVWTCPICGAVHPRDLFAAENILRQGIAELGSGSKPSEQSQGCSHVSHPTIPCK